MTNMLQRRLALAVLLAFALVPIAASAVTITYTESFNATGTANGNPFNGTVTFTLTSDTSLVFSNCDGLGSNVFCTPQNLTASFSIQGIGAGTFTGPWDVFDNQGVSAAGFTDNAIQDIVDLSSPVFATYDLKSAVGPVNSSYYFVLTGVPIGSSLGNIIIGSYSGTPTFTATIGTPDPASITLFGSGVIGLAAVLRRRSRL
jgi:hypothetical protein